MMTNGVMNESLNGVAELPDVEPEIFALLLEFAYTEGYKAATAATSQYVPEEIISASYFCSACSKKTQEPSETMFPYCSEICKKADKTRGPHHQYCVTCGEVSEQMSMRYLCAHVCDGCRSIEAFTKLVAKREDARRDSKLRIFHHQDYPALGLSHDALRDSLLTLQPTDLPTSEFSIHSKLYVVADKYMIDSLKELCLHKLQRDLGAFKPDARIAKEVAALLTYTYEHTSNSDDPAPNSGCRLRELVIAYASSRVEHLAQYDDFDNMLFGGGRLVVDLFDASVKRLKSR